MVCALTFQNGQVHFKSKFVCTKHRKIENEQRRYMYVGQMGTAASSALKGTAAFLGNLVTGKLPSIAFRNPSNTNSFYWGGKVGYYKITFIWINDAMETTFKFLRVLSISLSACNMTNSLRVVFSSSAQSGRLTIVCIHPNSQAFFPRAGRVLGKTHRRQ